MSRRFRVSKQKNSPYWCAGLWSVRDLRFGCVDCYHATWERAMACANEKARSRT